MSKPDTMPNRPPIPRRPSYGWSAWEATAGYMSVHHNPDVTLSVTVRVASETMQANWSSQIKWGGRSVSCDQKMSLAKALGHLWLEVKNNYRIYKEGDESAIRQPINYKDSEWLDSRTDQLIHRIIHVNRSVFGTDWHMVIIYQPIDNPKMRVQARMIARNQEIQIGGQGATLLDACRRLYTNAARIYPPKDISSGNFTQGD